MNKFFLLIIAIVTVTLESNAQYIEIFKNGSCIPVASYANTDTEQYRVVIDDTATKGTTEAKIDGKDVMVPWVQLWESGPRFAEYNVGATTATEIGTPISNFSAACGNSWGENWATPSKDDLEGLWTNTSVSYCQQSGVWGYKFTGIANGYTNNSIFLPIKNGVSYWSGTDPDPELFGDNSAWTRFDYLWAIDLTSSGHSWNYYVVEDQNNFYIRYALYEQENDL